ncbi:MAG: glycogen/starch/alpha-glucan phosphorylase [Polyangiales bacterium]
MTKHPSTPIRPELASAYLPGDAPSLRAAYIEKLLCEQGKFPAVATQNDHYLALAHVVRDRLLARWIHTAQTYFERSSRTVAYLSAEFLLGPQLGNNLLCLGLADAARDALTSMPYSLDALLAHEEEPGLGNGGLGRLAACYMDSLATLDIPAIGYGLRYEYGIFDQEIRDGQQVEIADKWLRLGFPWEISRPEILLPVGFGGATQTFNDAHGRLRVRWVPEWIVNGTPYDTPVLGYGTENANFVRLWHAVASESFDFQAFTGGDYYGAVEAKVRSETISKVLYPNDAGLPGKQLRLEQQYLLVACSLRDMLRLYLQRETTLHGFADKFAIQLNDTHPALAILELMRLLVDEYDTPWDHAWQTTQACFGYTNHTLLPEALETWGLPLFGKLLPRHLEIVLEINRRFLEDVRARFPGDDARVQRMSLIDERGERSVRMAHVASVGSHAINGVAELHSDLLKRTVLHDFAELYPERFYNVTNGVTPRRFIALANPRLAALISRAIGGDWLRDLSQLRRLEPFATDPAFAVEWRQIKRDNKQRLSRHVTQVLGRELEPNSLFDVQVKRMHEYKRQVLNALHAITLYQRIGEGRLPDVHRTLLFAGKAAPGYVMAKLGIRLIHAVAALIRRDPEARKWLTIEFIPDFNVKVAERIYPAADLSEQISLAGKEASGTGNMKLALNGALTIGTLDGANIEIRDQVGAENFYLFGLDAEQVLTLKASGYRPWELPDRDPELQRALGLIGSGALSDGDPERFQPLLRSLLDHDEYCVLADYRAYVDAQAQVARDFLDETSWTRRSILTVARMGHFSSDRAIREYCQKIWRVPAVPVRAGSAG